MNNLSQIYLLSALEINNLVLLIRFHIFPCFDNLCIQAFIFTACKRALTYAREHAYFVSCTHQ